MAVNMDTGNQLRVTTPKRRIIIDPVAMCMAPRKKTPPTTLTDFLDRKAWAPQFEWAVEDFRMSGFLFEHGTVHLYTRELDEIFLCESTPHISFSAKDWNYFRNKVCREMSASKGVYSTQWCGSVPGQLYRVETDLEVYDPESYIFFRSCKDDSIIQKARKGTPNYQKGYPLTSKEWETWYNTGFVVQWGEWDRTLEVFSHIDKLFRWYKPYLSYIGIKRKLFGPEDKEQ